MKIIICAGDKKREIEGSFSICGSNVDLLLLRDELNRALVPEFNYGWVDIIPNRPSVLANVPPEPWA